MNGQWECYFSFERVVVDAEDQNGGLTTTREAGTVIFHGEKFPNGDQGYGQYKFLRIMNILIMGKRGVSGLENADNFMAFIFDIGRVYTSSENWFKPTISCRSGGTCRFNNDPHL